MKKDRAIELRALAYQVADNFSRKDREFNFSGETFDVEKIIPTSENTAVILFRKNTGKKGLAFCYYINMAGGMWKYFFPTYDHCVGMNLVEMYLHNVEEDNFKYNFPENSDRNIT